MLKYCVAAALLVAVAAASVVEVTADTFDEAIQGDYVLMQFYAPWCGHCKKLAPEFDEAAKELKGTAVLAKIDASAEKSVAEKYQVQGFPTLKVFGKGELIGEYNGGRSAAEIVKTVKRALLPAVTKVDSQEALDALVKENSVVFALLGEATPAFEESAAKLRGSTTAFATVSDASLYGAHKAGSVVAFPESVAMEGDATDADAIAAFVKAEGVPVFDEMGPENYKNYVERKLPIVWLFTARAEEESKAAAKAAASSFKGKLSFVWIDSDQYGGMAGRLGIPEGKFPAMALANDDGHNFVYKGEFVADQVREFAQNFLDGKLERSVKTEDAPEEHTVEGLTTLVGSNFEELVSKADVPVFIEFYAPWCGHCKQLAPIFAEAAKELADKPVRVAKMDATANDYEQSKFKVEGFPTMYFVPKDGEPEQYNGGRTKEDIVSFLNSKL